VMLLPGKLRHEGKFTISRRRAFHEAARLM
jgi:hypothetical protein